MNHWDAQNVPDRRHKAVQQINEYQSRPFNPRTDVSADARYLADRIVKNLWTIVLMLPFVAVLVYAFCEFEITLSGRR
jgi:type VI protein secretion system component VasF